MDCLDFKKMPFGLVNAPATFSRLMRIVLKDLTCVDNFVDDIIIHSETWEKHMKRGSSAATTPTSEFDSSTNKVLHRS